jgi:hypothetical protein
MAELFRISASLVGIEQARRFERLLNGLLQIFERAGSIR